VSGAFELNSTYDTQISHPQGYFLKLAKKYWSWLRVFGNHLCDRARRLRPISQNAPYLIQDQVRESFMVLAQLLRLLCPLLPLAYWPVIWMAKKIIQLLLAAGLLSIAGYMIWSYWNPYHAYPLWLAKVIWDFFKYPGWLLLQLFFKSQPGSVSSSLRSTLLPKNCLSATAFCQAYTIDNWDHIHILAQVIDNSRQNVTHSRYYIDQMSLAWKRQPESSSTKDIILQFDKIYWQLTTHTDRLAEYSSAFKNAFSKIYGVLYDTRENLLAMSLVKDRVKVNKGIRKKYVHGLDESINHLEYPIAIADILIKQIYEIRGSIHVAILIMDKMQKREMQNYNEERYAANAKIDAYEAEMNKPVWWRWFKSWFKPIPDKPALFDKPKPQISSQLQFAEELCNDLLKVLEAMLTYMQARRGDMKNLRDSLVYQGEEGDLGKVVDHIKNLERLLETYRLGSSTWSTAPDYPIPQILPVEGNDRKTAPDKRDGEFRIGQWLKRALDIFI